MPRGRPSRATHGTNAMAQAGCGCLPCRKAASRYVKELTYEHAHGRSRRVDAGPIREHVQRLLDAGLRLHQIGDAATPKVYVSVLKNLMGHAGHEPCEWMHRTTAERIVAVTYADAAAVETLLPNVGVRRRIEALEFMGYSKPQLARELGITESAVFHYTYREVTKSGTVAMVDAAYRRLSMTSGDSEVARWKARREGYPPPMAWDEETIDDPDAQPAPVVCIVERCSRVTAQASLCPNHYNRVRESGAFEPGKARRYREAVLRLNRRQNSNDRQRLLNDLQDLRDLGYTPARAAVRLGRPLGYIEKMWRKVA